jgi:(E)-4-hydroxy-3-methylbut-2-enyl-diphosphate synthase
LLFKVETYTNTINKNINIAILGCCVNGVGECKQADVGLFGNKTHVTIYRNGKLYKTVKHQQAFYTLKQLINKH